MKIDVIYTKSSQRMDEVSNESVDMVMTSPPYWGLRDYGEDVKEIWGGDPDCEHEFENYVRPAGGGHANPDKAQVGTTKKDIQRVFGAKAAFCQKCGAWYGQLGLEPTFQLYLEHMMIVCAEIKRVLKKTGSFWLNMGDTYGGSCSGHGDTGLFQNYRRRKVAECMYGTPKPQRKIMAKCLLGIPSRLRNRLIDEQGWTCRNTVIWAKPNSMPSSKKDGLTPSYEFLFHFVKNIKPQYYWNEKTGLMADRKPPKEKQKEGIDWDYQTVGIVNENIFNVRVRDGDTERFLQGATDEEKKEYGKPKLKKRTCWHTLGYWYDLDAIREPHTQTSIARLFRGVDPGNKYDYANNPVEHSARNLSKPRLNIRKITRGPKEIPFKEQSIRPSGGDHHLMSNMLTSLQKSVLAGRGKNPGDVWTIPSQPRPEAHFATFPDKLCIKPILATCPQEICKKCGKARVRITETTYIPSLARLGSNPEVKRTRPAQPVPGDKGTSSMNKQVLDARHQTIGWTDCGCGEKFEPGILLDPFAGRGTALIVAKKLGRHYIGYELKKEYCEKLIRPALKEIDPLFNWKTPSPSAG